MINTDARNQIKQMFARKAIAKELGRRGRVADVRHNDAVIGYDKKTNYYNEWEKGRSCRENLNFVISCRESGIITDDVFYKTVRDIDRQVNLNKKSNQKQFINEKTLEYKERFPYMSNNQCKKMAESDLKYLLSNQQNRNYRRFSDKDKLYVFD